MPHQNASDIAVISKILLAIDYKADHEFFSDDCLAIQHLEEIGILDKEAFIEYGIGRLHCFIMKEGRNPFRKDFIVFGDQYPLLKEYHKIVMNWYRDTKEFAS